MGLDCLKHPENLDIHVHSHLSCSDCPVRPKNTKYTLKAQAVLECVCGAVFMAVPSWYFLSASPIRLASN